MKVNGPNGVVVNFPDGTDEETVNRVMMEAISQKQRSADPATAAARTIAMAANPESVGFSTPETDSSGRPLLDPRSPPQQGMRRALTYDKAGKVRGIDVEGGSIADVPKRLDAMMRGMANYGTFNQADKLAAGAGAATGIGGKFGDYSGNLEAQQQLDVKAQTDSPTAYNTGALFGVAANPANRFVGAGVNRILPGAGFLSRYTNAGAQGGIIGAAQGAGFAQPGERAEGALKGTGAGVVAGLAGRAVADAAGGAVNAWKAAADRAKSPAPSLDQIKTSAQQAYKTAEDAGVVIAPESYSKFVAELPSKLKGFDEDVTPGANNIIKALTKKTGEPITLEKLDDLRSVASGASMSRDENEARLAGSIVRRIDDFIDNVAEKDLVNYDAKSTAAIDALKNARSLWRTKSKLQDITDIVDTGEILNDQNWVKGRMRALVKGRNFDAYNEEEKKLIGEVARTGSLEKLIKLIPWRGAQMTSTYAEPFMQNAKMGQLQELVARGGVNPSSPGMIFGHSAVPALAGAATLPLQRTRAPQANGQR